jgi:hypothetical protein
MATNLRNPVTAKTFREVKTAEGLTTRIWDVPFRVGEGGYLFKNAPSNPYFIQHRHKTRL